MSGPVAILGSGGFVGARFVEMRVLTGRTDVVPVVRSFKSLASTARLGIPHRLADCSRLEPLRRAIAGCEAVVNLTAGDAREILPTTRTVYTACVAESVPLLVHMRSAVVYGCAERPGIADDAPPEPFAWMAYAGAKAAAETFLRAQLGGPVEVVVLRPGLVWGPRSPWVCGPAAELLSGAAYLVDGGRGICNLIYVDNLVRSVEAVIARRPGAAGFYHVADDETVTWRDYYGALARALGVDPASVPSVTLERYRPRLADRLDAVRQSPGYRRLKETLSEERREQLRFWLKRLLAPEPGPDGAAGPPAVSRDIWSLQKTRHRLPTAKFAARFGPQNADSFGSAMAKTTAWLAFAGFGPAGAPGVPTVAEPAQPVAGAG